MELAWSSLVHLGLIINGGTEEGADWTPGG